MHFQYLWSPPFRGNSNDLAYKLTLHIACLKFICKVCALSELKFYMKCALQLLLGLIGCRKTRTVK